ncbi:MAG: hypothetical protein E7627_06680 [Ruminococcaceae bacterium]|nr:hypothetical protein [Oscillospiraceae bacterium]
MTDMAKIKYTPAQKTAVYWKGGNLLLSAAAGSGKTAALTGRIAELVKEGHDLHSMLIVTYTKAAAAEMRGRISAALEKSLTEQADNPQVLSRISRAITKVPSAEISTIHSFLYRTLKPYFPVLGFPQDSRIADEKVVLTLKNEIIRNIVDDSFAAGGDRSRNLTDLADIIGQVRDTESVDRELLWIANRLTSVGQDHTALLHYAEELEKIAESGEVTDNIYGKIIDEHLDAFYFHYRKIFLTLADELEALPEVRAKYGDCVGSILEWLGEGYGIFENKPWDFDLLSAHFANVKGKITALNKLSPKHACDTSAAIKIFKDELIKDTERISKNFFSCSACDIPVVAARTARVMRMCALVIGEYFDALSQRKKEMSIVDYNDLEALGLRLLVDENGEPTPTALEVGSKYKFLFIDEYQDTNSVQDSIFRAISTGARRFMVGDIKQSIYRFRGASPEVFSHYRQIWETTDPIEDIESAAWEEDFDPAEGRALFMSENFRCDRPVTQLVNLVSGYMLKHGGIPYEDRDALVYAKNDGETVPTSPAAEVCLISSKGTRAANKSDDTPADTEAEYVADRIAGMIGKYSHDGQRIIKPGDIAILLRSPKADGEKFRDALSRRGITSALKVEHPLSSFPSIMLLWCVLNFIDNPLRDIYVTGALRSPIFGFTMSELLKIKEESDSPLYLAILDKAAMGYRKCADTVAWLEKQKAVSRGMRIDKFLEYLIDEIGLYSIDGIRENGAERDAINRFCNLAADFRAGSVGINRSSDISAFLDYAAGIIDSDDSDKKGGGGDQSVSIMSIHASKGLEFPVCFVSCCSKIRNNKDETRSIIYHGDMGFGMHLPDDSKLVRCDTHIRRIIGERIRQDSVYEEMRMLYVALTRAREHLIVTAKMSDPDKKLLAASIQAEFSDKHRVTGISSYIDWILEAAGGRERNWLKINVMDSPDGTSDGIEPAETPVESRADDIEAIAEEYRRRFTFEYRYDYLRGIPSKLTVSKLNPQILDDSEEGEFFYFGIKANEESEKPRRRPGFMSDGGNTHTAADRGTATHVFMQFADFAALRNFGVKYELDRLVRERFITPGSAELINLRQLERFAESGLLDKMLRAPLLKREFRFNVLLDASRFTRDPEMKKKLADGQIKVTVQGVVDCVFRDPDTGKLVLVDYKTDSITDEEWKDLSRAEEKLRRRHRDQLTYYREICSEMFGEEIEDALVYSTVLGRTVKV